MDKRKKFNRFNTRTKNKLKYSKKKFKQMLKKKYIKVKVKKKSDVHYLYNIQFEDSEFYDGQIHEKNQTNIFEKSAL